MDDPPKGPGNQGRPTYRMVSAAHYTSGTGLGGVFYLIISIPPAIVALNTSGVVSKVFWVVAGLFCLVAVAALGAYAIGYGRGGWTTDPIDPPSGGSPPQSD